MPIEEVLVTSLDLLAPTYDMTYHVLVLAANWD